MIIDSAKISRRAAGLDLFRVMAAVMVLLFHGNIHHGFSYGPLTGFASMGAIFMSAFFMLSGYVLFYTYREQSLVQSEPLKKFYLKRLIGIIPLYYLVSVLYVLTLGQENIFQNIVLLPIELLGLQSVFSSLFEVSHNSGTWFISCLLLAYLVFPLMQEIVKQMGTKAKLVSMGLCVFVLLWAPLVVRTFSIDGIYSNPFFRGLEFLIGVLLCSLSSRPKFLCSWPAFVVELFVLIVGVSMAVRMNLFVGNYMLYDWIAVPVFACMVLTLSELRSPRLQGSRVLRYASAVSYAFFLVQTFNTEIEEFLFLQWGIRDNVSRIVLSVVLCGIMAVVLHELVEKPCSRFLRSKTEKKLGSKG
ncbi:acyltransferase [uncultured Fibrobacter sp.]|uniref:acyltransferase family protein n=1 Tax=uncultured Fibrobacter sp. TaxID=261512 RepID=UPI00263854D2|nr:acyltransferase [uncultured Fibrobacter sp.]